MAVAAPVDLRNAVGSSGQAQVLLDVSPVLRVRRNTPDRIDDWRGVFISREPLPVLLTRERARSIAVHRLQLSVTGDLTGEDRTRPETHHDGRSDGTDEYPFAHGMPSIMFGAREPPSGFNVPESLRARR